MARVADNGAGWGGAGCSCEGEGVAVRSGYVIDGKDEVTEDWISSHFWDSSPVSWFECVPGRPVGDSSFVVDFIKPSRGQ